MLNKKAIFQKVIHNLLNPSHLVLSVPQTWNMLVLYHEHSELQVMLTFSIFSKRTVLLNV